MHSPMNENPVLIRIENGIGRITLNRPQALHALNTDMCRMMSEALTEWATDDRVKLLMIDHAEGTRGFCAGGDIRMVAESGRKDGKAGEDFFRIEYTLNTQIKRFPKPYIAFLDGVTMGGGVGISVHGSHRIATEHTLFAMPETGIGLFPDVGGGWFLPRLEGELGTWLALTGAQLRGGDVVAAGIATHFVPSDGLATLKNRLLLGEDIDKVLQGLSASVPLPAYAPHMETINRCFAGDTISEISIALNADGGEWALKQANILTRRSPQSLAVSLRQLREGRRMTSFEEVMKMEYRLACRITRTSDFSEGVRAVIEDKDNAPHWQLCFDALGAADWSGLADLIAPMFEHLGNQELHLP